MKRPTFKPSLRETLATNNAWDRYYALSAGLEPQCQAEIPEKRAYTKSGMPSESDVNGELREFFGSRTELQIWRNNRGVAVDAGGRHIRYGVGPNGASDWLGYKIVRITPEMVGQRVAIFAAIEAKRPGGKVAAEQRQFVEAVREDGGLAGIAESAADVEAILS